MKDITVSSNLKALQGAGPSQGLGAPKVGADTIIAHVGTTVGGSIGVVGATVDMDFAIKRT
jgi:predicted TIM-barrel enzyme